MELIMISYDEYEPSKLLDNIRPWLMEENKYEVGIHDKTPESLLVPVQNRQTQTNMLSLLVAYKPIKKLEALRLNWRLSSWHNDAKNFCRIYARMANSNAFLPKTVPLMARWAEMLLYFAKHAWDIDTKLITVDGRNSFLHMGNFWLLKLITHAAKYHTLDELYNIDYFRSYTFLEKGSFLPRVGEQGKAGIIQPVKGCCILHTPIKDYWMKYNTYYSYGYKDYQFGKDPVFTSDIMDSKSHKRLRSAIQCGLGRYRSQSAKDKLIKEVKENYGRNPRVRSSQILRP